MPVAFENKLEGIMNIGDTLTLIRASFNALIETATLTANRTYTLPDKSGTVALLDDIGGSSGKTVSNTSISTNIVIADINNFLRCTNSSAINLTIPASNGYAIGSVVDIIQTGTGQVTIVPGSGISLLKFGGTGNAVLIGQYARAQIVKLDANVWHCTGDVSI